MERGVAQRYRNVDSYAGSKARLVVMTHRVRFREMFGWRERRREARRKAVEGGWAAQYEALRLAGRRLQPTARRIWLEPGYPTRQPVNADVDEALQNWVWWPDTLPIGIATRASLEYWAYDRFDKLYWAWDSDPDVNADAERAYEADGIALARQLGTELGSDWEVGLFSVKLERPVWDLDQMPEDEWLYRFGHERTWDDDCAKARKFRLRR